MLTDDFEAYWKARRQQTWDQCRLSRDSADPPVNWSNGFKEVARHAFEAATLASSSAAREDAERLEWIEAQWRNGVHVEVCAVGGPTVHGLYPMATAYVGGLQRSDTSLRAAIDAARSATKGEGAG